MIIPGGLYIPPETVINKMTPYKTLISFCLLDKTYKELALHEMILRLEQLIVATDDEFFFKTGKYYYCLNNEPGIAASLNKPKNGKPISKPAIFKFNEYFYGAIKLIETEMQKDPDDEIWQGHFTDFTNFENNINHRDAIGGTRKRGNVAKACNKGSSTRGRNTKGIMK